MRVLGIEIAAPFDGAGFKEASLAAETFGKTVDVAAAKNVTRLAEQRTKLRELAAEYRAVAGAAVRGSDEQVAAARLAEAAERKLGIEVVATNRKIRATAGEAAFAERELGKFTRGAAEASGKFGKLGFGLAIGSGGFLAGAAATGGVKVAIDAAKELMDAREQLTVAARNVGASLNERALDDYLAAESRLSLFTKAELTASLVGLVRATGSVAKAQEDATLAANIARATGQDLATVTQGIINLEGGRTRSLVSLGVKIPVVKTATDALTASGKIFTGQQRAEAAALDRAATAAEGKRILIERYHGASEKFAKSDAAAQDKLRQSENLLATSIGTVLLPVVKQIADPFSKWAEKEAKSGDAARKTKEIVGDLTAVIKDAKGVVEDIDKVTGSFKHTLELVIGLKFASVIVGWTGELKKFTAGTGLARKGLLGLSAPEVLAGMALLGSSLAEGMATAKSQPNVPGYKKVPGGKGSGGGSYVGPNGNLWIRDPSGQMYDTGVKANAANSGGVVTSATQGTAAAAGGAYGNHPGAQGAGTQSGRQKMLSLAEQAIGTPYLWGGNGPGGFDCSGLVQWAFANGLNVSLPHSTYDQVKMGSLVGTNSLKGAKPGDVIFTQYGESGKAGPGHEGIYIGGGRVLSAPHTGAKVGISSLAGFTSGGTFTVRDLLGKGADNPAAAAALAAILAAGKPKPTPTKRGQALLGNDLLNRIAHAGDMANMAGSRSGADLWLKRELDALKDARTLLEGKLKGSTGKQRTAIQAELRTVDSQIAGVNKSITTNLKAQAQAIKSSAATKISAAKSAIDSAFSQIITDARSAFDEQTQNYIDTTLGAKYFQNGLLSPKEKQLADMQAADTAKSLTDTLTAAQKQLADDMNGSLLAHVVDLSTGTSRDIYGSKGTSAQVSADNDAIDAAKRAITENNLAIDAATDRAQTDKNYADAVKQYQQERSLAESQMTHELNGLDEGIKDGTAHIGDLSGILLKFGVDISTIPSDQWQTDFGNLAGATQTLAQVMLAEAAALAKIGDGKDAATVAAAAASMAWQTDVKPGQTAITSGLGGAIGFGLLNGLKFMDSGGSILSNGLIYAHAGEKVVPATVARGGIAGGLGSIHVTVVAPNYVGDQRELAVAMKSRPVVEAVAVAVAQATRAGHLTKGDLPA